MPPFPDEPLPTSAVVTVTKTRDGDTLEAFRDASGMSSGVEFEDFDASVTAGFDPLKQRD